MFNDSRKTPASPLAVLDQQHTQDQRYLQQQVGPMGQLTLNRNHRKRMVEVVDQLNGVRAATALSLGQTAIELAGQRLSAALVGSQLLEVGAQTHAVNTQASVIDRKLTQAAVAETASHVEARHHTLCTVQALFETGRLTADERTRLCQLGDELMQQDVQRTLDRTRGCKDTVQALAQRATEFIGNVRPNGSR
jgi:hypothetical protein